MISYTRPKNLRDILVRSQLPKQKGNKNLRKRVGFKRCNMTQCETCPYTKNTTTHTCNLTKEVFPIKEELSCFSENTIYSLTCLKGSGTFTKKHGKKAKEFPLDGAPRCQAQKASTCSKPAGLQTRRSALSSQRSWV